jgi:hypothetical protein
MHGAGKLFAQARDLQESTKGVHWESLANALSSRCNTAESRVARVQQVLDAFTLQLAPLPPEHAARKLGEQILATFAEAIK